MFHRQRTNKMTIALWYNIYPLFRKNIEKETLAKFANIKLSLKTSFETFDLMDTLENSRLVTEILLIT